LPDGHVLAATKLLDVIAEIDVRQEQDGTVSRDRVDDRDGVAGGAENVAFRFDLDRSVDVADDYVIGMLAAEGAHAFGWAAIDQTAAGVQIGQSHDALGIQDFGGFGHEADAAEHDDVTVEFLSDAGELETVANRIGYLLDLGFLVVMGQDSSPVLRFQVEDLFGEGGSS